MNFLWIIWSKAQKKCSEITLKKFTNKASLGKELFWKKMFSPRSALLGAFPLVIRVRLRLGVHQGEGQLRSQLTGQRAQVQLHLHLGRAQTGQGSEDTGLRSGFSDHWSLITVHWSVVSAHSSESVVGCPRNEKKKISVRTETRSVSRLFRFVSWN